MEDKKLDDIKDLDLEQNDEEEIIEEDEEYEEGSYIDGKIKEINISSEMKTSFLNYSMSVIVSRALPDVRDGLKPVQRRIIYGMNDLSMYANTAHKKSARIVGEVIGKYHPHGDSSVYEAMVRMAQPFSLRYPLVDGHGNFGSVDGDSAAAMRYTEARMSRMAMEIVKDLDKDTVDFKDNYDATEREPAVMPAKYPNLLVNGASGIAVGMATNIPPHNLVEVINGLIAYMDNKEITTEELMHYIKGPDFPTGGQILGPVGLRQAYETGNGPIVMRAKSQVIEAGKGRRNTIIITEIPYQVNKSRLIERIADIVKDKIVDGITDLRDESNRKGMRIVIEMRRDVNPYVMLNNLYKYTQLQSSFSINMIALVDNVPMLLGLKDMLRHYLDHQMEVIQRRTAHELKKAEERKHILDGLIIALENIDAIIELIKASKTAEIARDSLMETYDLTEIQARAILDMNLRRLTGIEIEKIVEENTALSEKIIEYKAILISEELKHNIIKEELIEIRDKYGDPRRSEMRLSVPLSIEDADLIKEEDVIITVTNRGYIKRMTLDEYKTQNRGGVGVTSIRVGDADFVERIQMTNTHTYHLFFTNLGRVYKVKGFDIPEGSRQSRGLPINNILPFEPNEELVALTTVEDFDSDNYLFFATKKGLVKRTRVDAYKNIRKTGIIAINLKEDDELYGVRVTDGSTHVLLGASNGKAIRFRETDVRTMGRNTSGVIGMRLDEEDEIIGMTFTYDEDEEEILVVTEKGYGKRSFVNEYRLQNRGGKGVKALNVTERNGKLKALRSVVSGEDVIVVSDRGIVIRMEVDQISQTRRATQGVRLINLRGNQQVATLAIVPSEEDEEVVDNNLDELIENNQEVEQMTVKEDESTYENEVSDNNLDESSENIQEDEQIDVNHEEIEEKEFEEITKDLQEEKSNEEEASKKEDKKDKKLDDLYPKTLFDE